ncbi:bifunctional transcriptional activator/DNA repair enzyme AdaA [Telmatobacter bradus]|uniref:bifunctional transcriptional activator/DNA repair enzyme AdaA n=1 Tax=Telmatobacter bradus TaxID=474953 RepID=UPI003B4305B3
MRSTEGSRPIREKQEEEKWRAVVERERGADFVYAVKTTGVFCHPGCSSRLPRRENVLFFATAEEATAAGFRACLRCLPTASGNALDKKSAAANRLREHIERNVERKISLEELGTLVGVNPHAARRIFTTAMGVSPLSYQRGLRLTRLRAALKQEGSLQGGNVTNAVYEAGYGSSSRAYSEAALGMSPGRFAQGGKGEILGYTAAHTAFGWIIVGATQRGLCWLSLAATKSEAEASLRAEFPLATLQPEASLGHWVEQAVESIRCSTPLNQNLLQMELMELDLRGTEFQLRVWQALRQIPRGQTRSYSGLAEAMGCPKSTRAVARACALNRVSLLVPCHRVVGASGSLTGYRWGVERKRKLLEAEGASLFHDPE